MPSRGRPCVCPCFGAKLYKLYMSKLSLVVSVDGTAYNFSFGKGRRFRAEKTGAGYVLIPKDTLAVNPSP